MIISRMVENCFVYFELMYKHTHNIITIHLSYNSSMFSDGNSKFYVVVCEMMEELYVQFHQFYLHIYGFVNVGP